ncbi:MAG: hypothetical protein AAF658_04390, partial [Myxococcota bacterium]
MSSTGPINRPGVGPTPSADASKPEISTDHPVRRFYQQVARRSVSDGFESGTVLQQFGREIARKDDAEATLDAVATQKVHNAQALLRTSADEVGDTFSAHADAGRAIIRQIRSAPTTSFGGHLMLGVDALKLVAEYEPALALALELAKKPETGGTELITKALDFLHLPDDVAETLANQLRSLKPVENEMQTPDHAEEVEPFQLAGFLELGDKIRLEGFLEKDHQILPRHVAGRGHVDISARLDDQSATLERMKDQLANTKEYRDNEWRELRSDIRRMGAVAFEPATDPGVRGDVFESFWRGIKDLTKQFPFEQDDTPTALIASQSNQDYLEVLQAIGPLKPDLVLDLARVAQVQIVAQDSGIGPLGQAIAELPSLTLEQRGEVLDALTSFSDLNRSLRAMAYAPNEVRAKQVAELVSELEPARANGLMRDNPTLVLSWPDSVEKNWGSLVTMESTGDSELFTRVASGEPLSKIVERLA